MKAPRSQEATMLLGSKLSRLSLYNNIAWNFTDPRQIRNIHFVMKIKSRCNQKKYRKSNESHTNLNFLVYSIEYCLRFRDDFFDGFRAFSTEPSRSKKHSKIGGKILRGRTKIQLTTDKIISLMACAFFKPMIRLTSFPSLNKIIVGTDVI